jgi:quinoprotein glucose dehydrogenase
MLPTGKAQAKEIREKTAVKLADGLKLESVGIRFAGSRSCRNCYGRYGRVYLNRTNRQKNSEFDIRGHRNWMTASIGLQTVEDRRAFLHSTFAPEKSKENNWLKDRQR